MKTLIIGGTGYIGLGLVRLYSKLSEKIYLFNRPDFDLLDEKKIIAYFSSIKNEKIKVIILSAINRTTEDTDGAFDKNILMIRNFIRYSNILDIESLVYISTIDVYGNEFSKLPIDEFSLINPSTGYGLSKYCCERLFSIENTNYPVAILRLPGVYGNYTNDQSVIGKLVKNVKTHKVIKLSNGGNNLRDYIHVDDVSNIVRIISKLNYSGIINIVTGKSNSIREISEIIFKKCGIKVAIEISSNYDRNFDLVFQNSKLINTIGKYNFIGINDGIDGYF